MLFQRPAPLLPAAQLRVVAPSSPFDQSRFDAGLKLLEARYRPELAPSLFMRQGFLAGDDRARLRDLTSALDDREVRAIVAARGGYGATRLLPELDVASVARAGKWLVGFSDVTALHALWARAGLCSLHGPMVCSLPAAPPDVQASFHALLAGAAPPALDQLTCLAPGRAEGRLFGGNLTVLAALVGTPYCPPMRDVVLALEDIGERPYRLDRMLTSMLQAGFFAGVRALLLGQFTACDEGAEGVDALAVLHERLSPLGIPIVANAPFGHVDHNTPLLLGLRTFVDAARGRVEFGEPWRS